MSPKPPLDQPAPTSPPVLGLTGWPATITNLSAAFLVCWLLYYGLTTTLPSIQTGFQTELRAEREMFREELKGMRLEVANDRRSQEQAMHALSGAMDRQTQAIAELVAEAKKNRQHKPGD